MALQGRPEPMNASPNHSKVRVSVKFADSVVVAGGTVSGKIEMECKTDKGLGIGIVMAELFAIEGLWPSPYNLATFLNFCILRAHV